MIEDQVKEIFEFVTNPVKEILTNVSNGNNFIESAESDEPFFEYTSFMEIWGDVTGQIYLSLSKKAVEQISLKLFSVDLVEMGDEEFYYESVKELINIIIGNCKNSLKSTGFQFDASLPEKIESIAAQENLSFSNYQSRLFSSHEIKISVNIAYY